MYRYGWLTSTDHDAVAEVVELVETVSAQEPFVGLPAQPSAAESALLLAALRGGLASGQTQLLGVRDESSRLIACVAIKRPATANQHHIGELTTGAVHPDHRGRHVVMRAFAAIVRRCEEVGIELLRLDVREGIRAERLWRAYGFEEYGRLADYGRSGGRSYAGVYLAQSVERLKKTIISQEVAHAKQEGVQEPLLYGAR